MMRRGTSKLWQRGLWATESVPRRSLSNCETSQLLLRQNKDARKTKSARILSRQGIERKPSGFWLILTSTSYSTLRAGSAMPSLFKREVGGTMGTRKRRAKIRKEVLRGVRLRKAEKTLVTDKSKFRTAIQIISMATTLNT